MLEILFVFDSTLNTQLRFQMASGSFDRVRVYFAVNISMLLESNRNSLSIHKSPIMAHCLMVHVKFLTYVHVCPAVVAADQSDWLFVHKAIK